MYSVVLALALTTATENPNYNYGCGYSGYSYGYSGCYSYGYSYCYSPCYSYCYSPCYSYCYTPCYSYYSCSPVKVIKVEEKKKKTGKDGKEEEEEDTAAPATIVVDLPADAKLTIDGAATTSTSGHRTFVSPDLEPGKKFTYTLRAEVTRDNKPVVMEEKITVRAGKETQVTLKEPTTPTSTK
jgi:uncharacterized protein (TIGR03000 family)